MGQTYKGALTNHTNGLFVGTVLEVKFPTSLFSSKFWCQQNILSKQLGIRKGNGELRQTWIRIYGKGYPPPPTSS